ncbi:MAG: prolipoprotein diacylglyceryl transferase [Phycisphaerales bacterium]|nr:prolipoprotein diacylglyceryl transferase [Phycisphaerales bacterium]
MIAEAYLHQLSPFAIELTESFGLRWYGLAYICGFLLAWWFIRLMARTGRSPLSPEQAGDLLFAGVLGVLIGGRIGYAAFYDQSLLVGFSNTIPWWDLLAINRGGMASHGGFLGVLVAFFIWGRKHHVSVLHLTDLGSVGCTAGLFFGRLANFVNGELWGKKLENQTDPPWWSVKYPAEITELWTQHPEMYGEQLAAIEPLRSTVVGGNDFYVQIVSEAYAGNEVVIASLSPQLTAWYPSQLFQAISDGPLLLAALLLVWFVPRKPGIVSGWFLIVYGTLRIFTEMFRQPDEGVSLIAGMSRGQLLSVGMIFAGCLLAVVCAKSETETYGGIFKKKQAST